MAVETLLASPFAAFIIRVIEGIVDCGFIIRAMNVYKSYPGGQDRIPVLKGVSLNVAKSEILSIVGASGAGKSTLLHLLGGLDKPDDGQILFKDQAIEQAGEKDLSFFRRQSVGFVFQFHHLLPEFTALENVLIPTMILRKGSRQRAEELLKEVGLGERMSHKPAKLSCGEHQRVAIVRALINEPEMILADEPTGSLDTQTGDEVYSLLTRLTRERGKTMIMVTHNQQIAQKADRIVHLKDGQIVPD